MDRKPVKGIHDHPTLKLGAGLGSGAADPKTITLDQFIKADSVTAPVTYDFDKNRRPFTARMWGNDQYGDCEIAGRCNSQVRLERVETRSTIKLTDTDAIDKYKQMTGCQSPGDANDSGLYTIDNLNDWRHGWKPEDLQHSYDIAAYGMVTVKNMQLVRLGMYLFHGIIIGADLPITVQQQFENNQPWDVVPNAPGNDAEPGSWGGHCLYGKAYGPDHIKLLTWQTEVIVTNAWWNEYVDEAYCVIDDLDTWFRHTHAFDIQGMIAEMKNAGITVNQ